MRIIQLFSAGIFFIISTILPVLGQKILIDSLNQKAYQTYREDVNQSKLLSYRALMLAKEQELTEQTIDSYINLSRCFRIENNWDSAYYTLRQAILLGEEVQYIRGLKDATNNLGICYLTQGKVDEAKPYLKKSLSYAIQIKESKGQANAYNNLAIIAESELAFDTARFYLNGALAVYKEIEDSSGISQTLSNLAFLFDKEEKNDSSIHYNFQALRIQEALGLTYQQASTENQIGDLYFEKGEVEKALEQYRKALKLFKDIGDITGMASTNINIGLGLDELDKDDEALSFLKRGVELAQQTEDPLLIGSSLVNLADFYVNQKVEFERSIAMLNEAIPYLKKAESNNLSAAYYGLGRIYEIKEQYPIARKWYRKALNTAEVFDDLKSQKFALGQLSVISEKEKKSQEALKYLQKYQIINDSLINLESLKTINQLNIEYESEKKEKENLKLENQLTKSELANVKQKALRNQILGIGSLILLLGLGGFIYYRYRQRIRIKEQEIELEQERLRKEQQEKETAKLRELDAMKTRFFTNISHEFRTPLTLIIGKNDQMKEAIHNPKFDSGFDMVGRNGHRLLDLVNQVLDVAKLEAGGMDLDMSRIDAIPFLKHMLYSFESMGEEKGVSLVFDSDLKRMDTAFDLKKIERVIFNLLSNAMKFTPKDGNINMGVYQKSDHLEISLTDSGVGIKASQLPYIFDRFYQADSSENQPQPGTGIGLSLVKELVELHDGKITVESELNQGTTFFISLPIPSDLDRFSKQEPENQLSPEALPDKAIAAMEEPSFIATKKEQILLIEDNPDVRAFVKEQILSYGYQVHEAADGIEGLEKAQETLPDLIISDIMMPRLDGYGVAKGLKADQRTSHIPVILLTSKASDESRIAGLELGVDDYLLKPFNAKELEIRIGNLIAQRKRLRERFSSATVIRPNEVSADSMDQEFLKKVITCIEENIGNEQFGIEDIADHVGMGVNNLNRKLSALVDQTAGKLIRSMRLQRAADLLKQKSGTIAEIAYDTGFNSHASFNRSFKKQFGVSPSVYQKEHG